MAKKKPAKSPEAVKAEAEATQVVNETPVVPKTEVAAVNADDKKPVAKANKDKTSSAKSQKGKKNAGNFFKKIANWFKGIFSELKKVTWPKGKDVVKSTAVVLVVVFAFFIVLFVIDYVLAGLLSLLIDGQWATIFI